MNELRKLTIAQMHEGLIKRDFSSVELVEQHINAVENEKLNAFITKTPEIAIKAARIADKKLSQGETSPLMGIPIGIKDLFCTKGVRTTSASKMLENFIPTYESTVSDRLLRDGAVMLGKLNMDEFAMGSATTNSYFGHVENVWIRKSDGEKVVPGTNILR